MFWFKYFYLDLNYYIYIEKYYSKVICRIVFIKMKLKIKKNLKGMWYVNNMYKYKCCKFVLWVLIKEKKILDFF